MIFKLQNCHVWPKPRPLEQPVINHESAQPHPCRDSPLRKMVMESFQQTLCRWARSRLLCLPQDGVDICHLFKVPGLKVTPGAEFEPQGPPGGSKPSSSTMELHSHIQPATSVSLSFLTCKMGQGRPTAVANETSVPRHSPVYFSPLTWSRVAEPPSPHSTSQSTATHICKRSRSAARCWFLANTGSAQNSARHTSALTKRWWEDVRKRSQWLGCLLRPCQCLARAVQTRRPDWAKRKRKPCRR